MVLKDYSIFYKTQRLTAALRVTHYVQALRNTDKCWNI